MVKNGLRDFMRDLNAWELEYPDDVDQPLEEEIDERIANDNWIYSFDSVVVVVSVAHWALAGDANSIADKRLQAQKKAASTFDDYDLSDVQSECGSKLFEGHEYQPSHEHIQRKWQRMFELLIKDIQRDRTEDN